MIVDARRGNLIVQVHTQVVNLQYLNQYYFIPLQVWAGKPLFPQFFPKYWRNKRFQLPVSKVITIKACAVSVARLMNPTISIPFGPERSIVSSKSTCEQVYISLWIIEDVLIFPLLFDRKAKWSLVYAKCYNRNPCMFSLNWRGNAKQTGKKIYSCRFFRQPPFMTVGRGGRSMCLPKVYCVNRMR